MKTKARIKSAQELADEREFSRRQNLSPYVQVRRMPGHNSYDVVLTLGTTDIGSKTERLRGGKVVSVHYFLPPSGPIEAKLREYMERPIARDARDPHAKRAAAKRRTGRVDPALIRQRVQISPRFDRWMMGDRYGVIVKHGRDGTVHVKLDKSGKTIRYKLSDLTPV